MVWKQHEIRLPAFRRGCHLVTKHIVKEVGPSLQGLRVGLCHVFIQHTSASLTINENADPDVRVGPDRRCIFCPRSLAGRGVGAVQWGA